jgi:hypothetical protein
MMKSLSFRMIVFLAMSSPLTAFAEIPIGADAAKARGIELPLPFGVTWSHLDQHQSLQVNRLDISSGGLPVPANMERVRNRDETDTLRVDMWLFPFLDLYAVAGRSRSVARGTATIPAGVFGPAPLDVPFEQRYKGDILGLGLTLAAGYKSFFATLDANYTETDIDISKEDAKATVITPRLGWTGQCPHWQGALWLGAMYQDLDQTLQVESEFNGAPVSVTIEEEAEEPWNYLVGASWAFKPYLTLIVEGGFGDREQWMSSLSYRF